MTNKKFTATIEVYKSPQSVFKSITNERLYNYMTNTKS